MCFKTVHLSLLIYGFTMQSSCARFVQVALWDRTLSIQHLEMSSTNSTLCSSLAMSCSVTLRFSLSEQINSSIKTLRKLMHVLIVQ